MGDGRRCERLERLAPAPGESPAVSAVMFSAGVLGNATALALLLAARRRRRARRERPAPFHVLVLALVLTDLLGTCLLSPVVLAAYGRGRTLVGLGAGGGEGVCLYFAFAMSFFSLATMGCLGAMALERSLAIGAPYLYERLAGEVPPAVLLGALPALYALAAAFCALPLLGFGRYVQYCPGTWCFIQMGAPGAPSGDRAALTFALLYASLLLLLILAVLLCNLSVIVNLVRMHRRGKAARRLAAPSDPSAPRRRCGGCCWCTRPEGDGDGDASAVPPSSPSPSPRRAPKEAPLALGGRPATGPPPARRALSVSEELDHLILLSVMTVIFAVCSLPFTIRAFMNNFTKDNNYAEDLQVMRFLSVNSIIDPWVFTILRPPVLRLLRSIFSCRTLCKSRTRNKQGSSLAKPKPMSEVEICRQ